MKYNKLIHFYITHRNYLNKGYEQISWVKWLVQFTAYSSGIIYFLFPQMHVNALLIACTFLGAMIGCWCIGYFWDKYKVYSTELEFENQRNLFVQHVKRKLK